MTTFAGTFVPHPSALFTSTGGLEGVGSIELAAGHIVFRGHERRRGVATLFAGLVATVVTVLVVMEIPSSFVSRIFDTSPKGMVLVVGLPLLSTFWVVWRGLLRFLPLKARQETLSLTSVVNVSLRGPCVYLSTSAHELTGISQFVTDDPQGFVDEYQLMRSGKGANYREPPPTHWSVK